MTVFSILPHRTLVFLNIINFFIKNKAHRMDIIAINVKLREKECNLFVDENVFSRV